MMEIKTEIMFDGELYKAGIFERKPIHDPSLYRVRCEYPCWKRFVKFLRTCSNILAVVYETPRNENPHVHALIESDKSEDAIKRARTRFFKDEPDMKGNGVASISECDKPNEYMEYMAKGRYAIKENGVYKRPDEPFHNVIALMHGNYDWQKLYNDFWTRHNTPMTKTQQKKRMNFTEEVCKQCAYTFALEDYRYIDNYSRQIIKCSEDEYISGWYNGTCFKEIEDLKTKYKQVSPKTIVKWLMDLFCFRTKIFDDYMLVKYLNLIMFKYRHHFVSSMHDTSSRISNILQKAGFDSCIPEEASMWEQRELEDLEKNIT